MKNKHSVQGHDSTVEGLVKTNVFGIGITDASQDRVLEFVLKTLDKKKEKYFVVTPNPEIVVYALRHPEFKKILNTAKIALCDGMQLYRAATFVGKPIEERIAGVEFMETISKYISKKPITVGFLGGRDGVAKIVSERLMEKYPGLKVAFVGEEWSSDPPLSPLQEGGKTTKEDIPFLGGAGEAGGWVTTLKKKSQPQLISCDILFVAFGFPKQEEWMFKNLSKLNVTVMIGVGGAFDYISGRVPRAPVWVQSLGFEWLYRLIVEPWRWRRQLALVEFLGLVVKEKFSMGYAGIN